MMPFKERPRFFPRFKEEERMTKGLWACRSGFLAGLLAVLGGGSPLAVDLRTDAGQTWMAVLTSKTAEETAAVNASVSWLYFVPAEEAVPRAETFTAKADAIWLLR
jgi:hypothetical protein